MNLLALVLFAAASSVEGMQPAPGVPHPAAERSSGDSRRLARAHRPIPRRPRGGFAGRERDGRRAARLDALRLDQPAPPGGGAAGNAHAAHLRRRAGDAGALPARRYAGGLVPPGQGRRRVLPDLPAGPPQRSPHHGDRRQEPPRQSHALAGRQAAGLLRHAAQRQGHRRLPGGHRQREEARRLTEAEGTWIPLEFSPTEGACSCSTSAASRTPTSSRWKRARRS